MSTTEQALRDLLPCPFCGSTDLEFSNLVDPDDYYVSCRGCQIQQIANYTPEEARRRWNRRVAISHTEPQAAEGSEVERKAKAFDWLCHNCAVFDASDAPGLKAIPWLIDADLESVEAAMSAQRQKEPQGA